MTITADGSVFHVRLRFTDGRGHYSRFFTTDDINMCFPLSDPMNSSDLLGELGFAATYLDEENAVLLTDSIQDSFGVIEYEDCVLPETFTAEFSFFHAGVADSVYFYFFCDVTPSNERGVSSIDDSYINGFIIAFSEYNGSITTRDSHSTDESVEWVKETNFIFEDERWYTAKIIYADNSVWVYIDDVLYQTATGLSTEFSDAQIKYGIGARTGTDTAAHLVRGFSVVIPETTPGIDNVEDLRMFSWGRQVWTAWEESHAYKTLVEINDGETWNSVTESLIETDIGEV